jgi:biotin operon repressor
MEYLRQHRDAYFSEEELSDKLGIKKSTVGAALSVLRRTGWVERNPTDPTYKVADSEPVEDRENVVAQYVKKQKPKAKPAADGTMVAGQEYIVRCLTIDQDGNPVIQIEDTAVIYHGLKRL